MNYSLNVWGHRYCSRVCLSLQDQSWRYQWWHPYSIKWMVWLVFCAILRVLSMYCLCQGQDSKLQSLPHPNLTNNKFWYRGIQPEGLLHLTSMLLLIFSNYWRFEPRLWKVVFRHQRQSRMCKFQLVRSIPLQIPSCQRILYNQH